MPHPKRPISLAPLSAWECYEACVQSPRHVVSLLRAVYRAASGTSPRVLHEDFCGTAAVSRRFVEDGARAGEAWHALATDLDEQALAQGERLLDATTPGVVLCKHDCLRGEVASLTQSVGTSSATPSDLAHGADIIWVGNFSICYAHTRAELVRYLAHCLARLRAGNQGFGGGFLAVDIYGGKNAYTLGSLERTHTARTGEQVRYLWQHEAADPRTGMVRNSISMRLLVDGEVVCEYPRAFVYDWRLWSLAELREAMHEVGFESVELHKEVALAPDEVPQPLRSASELPEDYAVVLVARGERNPHTS
jgi:hypothetical protein